MKRWLLVALTLGLIAVPGAPSASMAQEPPRPSIGGAWSARTYQLKGGPEHRVEGTIFFTESDWTVLFFVVDSDGEAKRASAEGGTYTPTGGELVLTHLHFFAAGDAMEGLAESPMSMVFRDARDAPTEPTRVEVQGDVLTLFFPTGNFMRFERSSGRG